MTVPASRARRWPSALGIALPLLLIVSLLIPVTVLFLQTRQTTDDDRSFAVRERNAITYLRSLGHVTVALVDAQSAAVAGGPVPGESLTRAVEETTAVDTRLGGDLRARERWAGLRAKIEALQDRGLADVNGSFTAYSEVTDLLLALYTKVRESSGLSRDPEADSYYLQDGVVEELPEALVAAGRLTDLAVLASTREATDRDRAIADFSAAREAVLSPAGDLVDDLLAAVDNTASANLGSNLLRQIDVYQRAVATLGVASTVAPPAAPAGNGQKPATTGDGKKSNTSGGTADRSPSTNGGTPSRGTPSGTGTGTGTGDKPTTDGTGAGRPAGREATVDSVKINAARASAQSTAVELSGIILSELDALIKSRIDDLDGQRQLSLATAALALVLVIALVAMMVVRARRRVRRRPRPGDATPDGPDNAPGPPRWDAPGSLWSPPLPADRHGPPDPPALAVRDSQSAQSGRSDAAR